MPEVPLAPSLWHLGQYSKTWNTRLELEALGGCCRVGQRETTSETPTDFPTNIPWSPLPNSNKRPLSPDIGSSRVHVCMYLSQSSSENEVASGNEWSMCVATRRCQEVAPSLRNHSAEPSRAQSILSWRVDFRVLAHTMRFTSL